MQCPKCGGPIPEGAKICPRCGEDVTASEPAPAGVEKLFVEALFVDTRGFTLRVRNTGNTKTKIAKVMYGHQPANVDGVTFYHLTADGIRKEQPKASPEAKRPESLLDRISKAFGRRQVETPPKEEVKEDGRLEPGELVDVNFWPTSPGLSGQIYPVFLVTESGARFPASVTYP
jgi:hypothetical protein